MKFEENFTLDTFKALCSPENTFLPGNYSLWPKCKPGNLVQQPNVNWLMFCCCSSISDSTCSGLPPPPTAGYARLITPGYAYGPCLGLGPDFDVAPSCPDVEVKQTRLAKAAGSSTEVDFAFRAKYVNTENRDLQYFVSFSYDMSIKDVGYDSKFNLIVY
jgi:hypothetical protein